MKELSTEEKAKRYDELLVKLQEAKVDNDICDERYCCVIDDIVPELKESEDERIKKQIIGFLKEFEYDHYRSLDFSSWIDWLEKQDDANKEYWRGYREGKKEILDKYAKLEKQGEQKTTWKPTEEQIEALEHLLETIRRHEYSYFHEEKFLLLHSLLEQLKEL